MKIKHLFIVISMLLLAHPMVAQTAIQDTLSSNYAQLPTDTLPAPTEKKQAIDARIEYTSND